MRVLAFVAIASFGFACNKEAPPSAAATEPRPSAPEPEPAKESPKGPGRILILTGDKTPEGAAKKLAETKVPSDLVPAAGWPRVIDSSTVKGLNPGFYVVALGMCPTLEPYDREFEDGRSLYFQWSHHDHVVAKTKAAFAGSYAKAIEAADDACPTWRGPRPEGEAAAAWETLGETPDDVAALLTMHGTATDPDTATYFTERVLELDPTNEDALMNVGG